MFTGPKLVTKGLVFGSDTGYPSVQNNEDSYKFNKGEPTTNEFYNTGSAGNILDHAGGYGGYGTVQSGALDAFGTTNCPVYRNTGKIRLGPTGGQDIGTLTNGNTYTFSVYLKHVAGQTESTSMEFDIVDRASSYSFSGTLGSNMTYEWKRFSVTALHNNNSNYHFVDLGTYQGTNVFDWCMPQIEVGSHATPHTKTSRLSTTSLIDLTRTTTIDVDSGSFDSNGQLAFDGTDDYITVTTPPTISTEFTVSTWIKTSDDSTDGGSYRTFFATGGYSSGTTFKISIRTSNGRVDIWQGGASRGLGTTNVADGNWHLITYTKNSSQAKIYVDGKIQSQTNPGTFTTTLTFPYIFIGLGGSNSPTPDNGGYFNGQIAATKIYNRDLNASEILQNFKAFKKRFNI